MNHFFRITSEGGYLGRWYWHNTGIHPDLPHWGMSFWLPDNNYGVNWAGTLWAVRLIVRQPK